MTALVEYYPRDAFGLHWEATAVDDDDRIRGVVIAEANDGWVVMGHIEDDRRLLRLRPTELARLRDALVSGEFDHLMRDNHKYLRRPTTDAEVAAMWRSLRRPWYRRLLRTVTGR
ncbi:hypothetical protein [Kitasatospora sp. NPDC059673]|uniref:hypothetical protein n=1 Tax=Kitasatospora sp. NPDC059673 TaxID=3346901 RepID=UPI0036BA438E